MELAVTLQQPQKRTALFGPGDANLRRIRDALGVAFSARNSTIRITGDAAKVSKAAAVIERLQESLASRDYLDDSDIEEALAAVNGADSAPESGVLRVFTRDSIAARTEGQKRFISAMLASDLTICLGPAGTGKTYLAVAVAVHMLRLGKCRRIALVRPAVEAGEKLGFLPGDLQQKVNPYLRPLFDAMHDMMTYDQLKRFMVSDVIEVIPLAYMRGRTLSNAVVILDEAQNATPTQMLMFLTRLGEGSRMIVTGDDSQTDLPFDQPSGLIDAVRRLSNIPGVSILRLEDVDIVRHRLVQEIVSRYSDFARRRLRTSDKFQTPESIGAIERPEQRE